MSEKTSELVRLIYSVALSVMTVIFGVLLIWQILSIYFAGNDPLFSRESFGAAAMRILPAFCVWVCMIIGGFIVWEVFPVARKKGAYNDPHYSLYRLKKRMPKRFEGEFEADYRQFRSEELKIKLAWLVVAVAGIACAIYSIVYLATPSNFPAEEDVSVNVINMALHVMIFIAAVFVLAAGVAVFEICMEKRMLPLAKKLAAVKKTDGNSTAVYSNGFTAFIYNAKAKVVAVTSNKYFTLGVRITIACVGVVFVIVGIVNGNAAAVLRKAIKICLECIGVG